MVNKDYQKQRFNRNRINDCRNDRVREIEIGLVAQLYVASGVVMELDVDVV